MAIQFRKGLKSQFTSNKLLQGEPAYISDTKQLYIGDGSGGVTEYASKTSVSQDVSKLEQAIQNMNDDILQKTADNYSPAIRATASGSIITLDDVSPVGTLRRAAVRGATTQDGIPSPDVPVAVNGVKLTQVTAAGKNLLENTGPATSTGAGVTFTKQSDGTLRVTGTRNGSVDYRLFGSWGSTTVVKTLPAGTYTLKSSAHVALQLWIPGGASPVAQTLYDGKPMTYTFAAPLELCMAFLYPETGYAFTGSEVVSFQINAGSTAGAYVPYAGTTYTLTTLVAMFGDGTVNDTYDAVSGTETRAWTKIALGGTEAWTYNADYALHILYLGNAKPTAANAGAVCTHYTVRDTAGAIQTNNSMAVNGSLSLCIKDTRYTTAADFNAWLAAQKTAGTPVTVVYQLATPTTMQRTAQSIKPPAPYAAIFADAGTMEVEYNRDATIVTDRLEENNCRTLIGTFATRPVSVAVKTFYVATDKAVGSADRLTVCDKNSSVWLQI